MVSALIACFTVPLNKRQQSGVHSVLFVGIYSESVNIRNYFVNYFRLLTPGFIPRLLVNANLKSKLLLACSNVDLMY